MPGKDAFENVDDCLSRCAPQGYNFRVPGVVVHHQDECLAAEVEQVHADKFPGTSR